MLLAAGVPRHSCNAGHTHAATLPCMRRHLYRLVLTYKLSLGEAGKVKATMPLLNKCAWGHA